MLRFLFIIVIVQHRKDYINMGGQWLLWHSRHIDAVMRMLKSFTPPRSLCAVRMWPRKLKVIRMKGGNRGLMKSPRKVSILSVSSETNRKSILGKDSSERNLLGCTEKSAGKIKESCEDSHWTLQVQGLNCAAAAMSLKAQYWRISQHQGNLPHGSIHPRREAETGDRKTVFCAPHSFSLSLC